jgi:hypothetical protein
MIASSVAALLISGLLHQSDLADPTRKQSPLAPDQSVQEGNPLEVAPASASGRELAAISEPLG